MRLITDIFEFCAGGIPASTPSPSRGTHIREAGRRRPKRSRSPSATDRVRAGRDRRRARRRRVRPQLSFFFNAHNNIFEEAAKFAPPAGCGATIMEERFDAQNPKSNSSSSTPRPAARRSLPSRSRTTSSGCRIKQALAAVLGGTQSLHTNRERRGARAPDRAVGPHRSAPSRSRPRSGAADTIDPLAGSYYVENLTDRIGEDAFEILEEVDRRGGMLEAVKSQWVQRRDPRCRLRAPA